MDRFTDRALPFLFGALLLVSSMLSWLWSDMKVRYEVMQDLRPRFCLSCDGVGEVDMIEKRVEDGKACDVKRAEPCTSCKGCGVTRNYLGKRKQIDLPGVTVRDTKVTCGHSTWSSPALVVGVPSPGSITFKSGLPFECSPPR